LAQPLERSTVAAGVGVDVDVALDLSPDELPHPAATSASEAMRTARCRDTAGKDNGRLAPLPRRPSI
jgi:hypothetical protein